MSEWISVGERLPDSKQRVLIFSVYGRELVTYNPHERCWDDSDGDDYYRDIEWATHWMPLPDPPKDIA